MFLLRVIAVGIFVIENINHFLNFEDEVTSLVVPAVTEVVPIAMVVHAVTICLGISGSLIFLFASKRHLRIATSLLALFMCLITWTWWFRRHGVFVWEVSDIVDRKNRMIHCLKNASLFGFITLAGCHDDAKPIKSISVRRQVSSCEEPLFPRLLIALRPWSFPAALTPLLITFTLLWPNVNVWKAAVFTLGILALQSCANLMNSFCDFSSGLDKAASAGDRTMVDALVSKSEFPYVFLYLILTWFVTFILTIPSSNNEAYLTVYAIGIALAVLYSAGSRPLKYIGLGDLTVFLAFGPLLVISATMATTLVNDSIGTVLLMTAPASLLVVAILHANNHRDMKSDAKNNANTVSVRLGERTSRLYYDFLVLTPPIFSIIIAACIASCRGGVLGALVLPLSWRLTRMIRQKPKVPRDIDAETAKVMMLFGILTSIGIIYL